MQCWNCGFENIPGLHACARCTSPLALDCVGVDPPRASRLRAGTQLERTRNRLRSLFPSLSRLAARLRILMPEPLSWPALVWSFIPGLGHIKTNRPRLGRLIMLIWLVLFVLALLCIGTSWINLAVTGMVAVHAFAIVTLFAAHLAYERLVMRAAFGLVVFLCLRFFLYEPGEWLGTRFWVPVPIDFVAENRIIANGDGLVFEGPWMRPDSFRRGDVVVYEIEPFQSRGYAIRSGLGVDRIVGVPGDRIQLDHGRLLVNGGAPLKGAEPLGGIARLGDIDTTLSPREYAIFPTLLRPAFFNYVGRNQHLPAEIRRRVSVARYDSILGRVVLRVHPLSRFGSVE